MAVGIDVGARLLHVVALDVEGTVVEAGALPAPEAQGLAALITGAAQVAIDSPDRWSAAPHAHDASLSPKFRTARCGEIGLGREHRMWVPWVTPTDPGLAPGWMRVGVDLFARLRADGHDPVEVYPYAAFRVLRPGRRLPPKRSAAGGSERLARLDAAGVSGVGSLGTHHDLLDAAVAALVALHRQRGTANTASCGHDGSAIWLPSATGVAEPSQPPFRRGEFVDDRELGLDH